MLVKNKFTFPKKNFEMFAIVTLKNGIFLKGATPKLQFFDSGHIVLRSVQTNKSINISIDKIIGIVYV
jgi:hypothetical protein